MDYYNVTYQGRVVESLQNLYYHLISFLPTLLAAAVLLLLGWLIAVFAGALVEKLLRLVKVDVLADRLGMDKLSDRVGRRLSIAKLGHFLIKWFVLIGVFIGVAEVLGLEQVSTFLYNTIFPYFGDVLAAVIILLIGGLAANFLSDLVRGTLAAGEMESADALAGVTKWAIIVFAVLAALAQLNIAEDFLKDLWRGIVVMLAIAGGISFGLGGKDHARKVLDHIENDMKSKR
jgi:hypothetical protein